MRGSPGVQILFGGNQLSAGKERDIWILEQIVVESILPDGWMGLLSLSTADWPFFPLLEKPGS